MSYAEIVNLTNKFYLSLDMANYEQVLKLFAQNGCWYRGESIFEGHEQIRDSLAVRSTERVTSHQISNLSLLDSDKGILSQYYLTVYSNQGTQLVPTVVLLMTDYWIIENGQWRIYSKKSKTHLKI